MLTPKQQKLIQLLIDNYGKKDGTKSLGKLIIEAGYSEKSAVNPSIVITEEMKQYIQPVIQKMEAIRTNALDKITDEKLKEGSARDNAYVADILTKNIQLLNGGATERITITKEDDELANKAFEYEPENTNNT